MRQLGVQSGPLAGVHTGDANRVDVLTADDMLQEKLTRYRRLKDAGIEPYVDIDVAALVLDVSPGFIAKWESRGKIRMHRLAGKLKKYRIPELLRELESIKKPGRPRKVRKT